jgi:hypothetical protein
MSTNDTYLAVFLGGKGTAKAVAWEALPEAERNARYSGAWRPGRRGSRSTKGGAIVTMGGPLGKTKKVDSKGVADISNPMTAFTVVRAASHEAAAKIFEDHPHFSIFPGESVEIMPVLPIPGG